MAMKKIIRKKYENYLKFVDFSLFCPLQITLPNFAL